MISGTLFTIEQPDMVEKACHGLRPGLASAAEIAEIRQQCDLGFAMCLACEDGTIVVELRDHMCTLEMFILMGVAFKDGAFGRQEQALLDIAHDMGAEQVAFQARRRGWSRRLSTEWRPRGSCEFVRSI